MDHAEAREQLELAAVEPGGLDRLMAGDTAAAAAVAGHLAGCPSCADELERLRRAAQLLRDVVRTTPPADLRERTLAYVRERGVARGATVAAAPIPSAPAPARRTASVLPWVASIAAAVVLSVAVSTIVVTAQVDQRLAEQDRAIAGLEAVTTATLDVTAEPDVQRVALSSVDGSMTTGSLLFSPSTTELVVVAEDLAPPPDGSEYRCWVESGGEREMVGKMYFADELAYWAGDTPGVAELSPGATFGVSLVEIGGDGAPAEPVIVGHV